jgi:hypothetical protein
LSQAIDVAELQDDHLKFVIYGQNRVGKTTLACQFPKPLLLISFEPAKTGGAKSVKNVPGVRYLRVTSLRQAQELAQELKADRTYKTHVLDTATSYQDLILQELLDLDALPEQLNWGTVSRDVYRERSEKTREGLRPFLNLDAHTVVCAKERDHNPPDRDKPKMLRGSQPESFFASDLGGATVGWLHDVCDYVCRLYVEKEVVTKTEKVRNAKGKLVERQYDEETGRQVRRLRTMLHPNYAAGFRSERPAEIPEFVQADSPEEMYNKVMVLIRGG